MKLDGNYDLLAHYNVYRITASNKVVYIGDMHPLYSRLLPASIYAVHRERYWKCVTADEFYNNMM